MIQLSVRQILTIAVLSAVVAAGLVIGYDRWGERRGMTQQATRDTLPSASTSGTGSAEPVTDDERNNIDVYRQVSPGVVNVNTVTYVRDFFYVYPQEGGGSGSIIDERGYILTNYHVVEGARKLTVTLANGGKYAATYVGGDADTDLAVIKIDAPKEKFTVVKMSDSSRLVVGQKVLAIGNPFGFGHTLTEGIISALERPIRAENGRIIEGAIQTDASINPGNSGGPLLNSHGEMIGINSQIITPSQGSVGIGFAIPVNLAKRFVPDLIAHGRVIRPWLGVEFLPVPVSQIAGDLGLPVDSGLMVSQVYEAQSADRAGVRGGSTPVRVGGRVFYLGGDIITSLDGEKINSLDDVQRVLNRHQPGDTMAAEVVRANRRMTLSVKLMAKPAQEG
jgi:S1-C subfamily serine protease